MSGHFSQGLREQIGLDPAHPDLVAEHARIADGPAPEAATGSHTLTNHGGSVIAGAAVYAIFPGPMYFDVPAMAAFGQDMVLGGYLDGTKEQGAGRGAAFGFYQYPEAPAAWRPGVVIAEQTILQLIDDAIAAGHVPPPAAETLYMVFAPQGVITTFDGNPANGASCANFCGFHSYGTSPAGHAVAYGIVCDCTCSGCLDTSAVDGAQMVFAHETAEAITDRIPGQGWYEDATGMENADICAWQQVDYGPWKLQPYWTNASGATVGPYEDHHTVQPQPQPQPERDGPPPLIPDGFDATLPFDAWLATHAPTLFSTLAAALSPDKAAVLLTWEQRFPQLAATRQWVESLDLWAWIDAQPETAPVLAQLAAADPSGNVAGWLAWMQGKGYLKATAA